MNGGSVVLKTRGNRNKSYTANPEQKKFLSVAYYINDTVVVATQRGIEKIDLSSGKSVFLFPYRTNRSEKLTRHTISLHRVSQNVFILNEDKDLYEFDATNGKLLTRLVDLQSAAFLSSSLLTKFFCDSQKNLWLLTESKGITRINYHTAGFSYYGSTDRVGNFVKTIFVDKDQNLVFMGTVGNGLQIFDTTQRLIKQISKFPGESSIPTVAAILKTNKDEYMVFLMGVLKAYFLNVKTNMLKPAKIDSSVTRFKNLFDYHLAVWPINKEESIVQNSYNIYKVSNQNSERIKIQSQIDLPIATTSSYLDQKNRLWVGGKSSYFLINTLNFDFIPFRLNENILIRCFYRDRGGKNWMGTEKGLYQLNDSGAITRIYYREDGLPDENIYSIREDRNRNLWFSHNKGISCMKPNGSIINFGKNDSLQENEFNTNTSFETSDGELYFGGVNGISSFYPERILKPSFPSRMLITSILVSDREYESDSASWNVSRIELPYYKNNLSFQFTSIGDPYLYQYRMSGLNENWVRSSSDNIARYVLPPGKYQFELAAGNGNSALKRIAVIINPPFWKTRWFIILVSIAIIGLIILVTRYLTRIKLKQRILELEQKRALDGERMRISREMHDDIGAGLTQITMMSESIRNKDENTQQLEEIANTSRKLVSNISEIIWSLNPENNSLDEFLGYLREQLYKLLQYSGIHYEIDFPENGKKVLLNNAQKRNLLLITKEIVHNAVKHSGASRILICCNQEGNSLQFIIKDDGRSFDPAMKYKGNGLSNIRRRITELSGNLAIDSSNGSGTTFTYGISLN